MKLHRNQHKKEIHKKKPRKLHLFVQLQRSSLCTLFPSRIQLTYIVEDIFSLQKKFFPLNKYYFEYFFLIVQKQFVKKMHRLHTFIQNFIHITKTATNLIK